MSSYANVFDLRLMGLPRAFFSGDLAPDEAQQQTILDAASAYIDTLIQSNPNIALPLSPPYDPSLVKATVVIAVWDMLSVRGYDPENPTDRSIRVRYEDTVKWLDKIANGRAMLQRPVPPPNPQGPQPMMASNSPRGLRNWRGSVGFGGR